MQLERKFIRLADVEVKTTESSGLFVFEGYAAKFGEIDTYRDTIEKGAFTATLDGWKSGSKIHMYYNHKYDDWMTARPLRIGKWLDLYEDEIGLRCSGELTPNHSLATDVAASIKHGTIDGLSIGYWVPEGGSEYSNTDKIRRLKQINLYEISPVDEPADRGARIGSSEIKSLLEKSESLADLERVLRDVGNFSRSAATAIVAQVKRVQQREVVDDVDQLDMALKRLNSINFPKFK